MTRSIFELLTEPFPPGDIEWRISRSGMGRNGKPWARVLAYITARAIATRLDEVVGPENWCNTPQEVKELRPGVFSIQVGISIRFGDSWITKYDVSDPTQVEPVKGGFSGAMKRAGAQWGIGRYLYHMTEAFADVITPEQYSSLTEDQKYDYCEGKLAQKRDSDDPVYYYWKPKSLPAWALPFDQQDEQPVTKDEISALKRLWQKVKAPDETSKQSLAAGFTKFVVSIVGQFPVDDPARWTQKIRASVAKQLEATKSASGPSGDVPFER